jgi:hypothetical protein
MIAPRLELSSCFMVALVLVGCGNSGTRLERWRPRKSGAGVRGSFAIEGPALGRGDAS